MSTDTASPRTWTEIRDGGRVSEQDPLPSEEVGAKMRGAAEALCHVEDVVVTAGGAALRYGAFYGPGSTDERADEESRSEDQRERAAPVELRLVPGHLDHPPRRAVAHVSRMTAPGTTKGSAGGLPPLRCSSGLTPPWRRQGW